MLKTRRTHRKSHNGCMTCKQKKIKCDELKPSCNYCTLRSIECVYSSSNSAPPKRRAAATPKTTSPEQEEVFTPPASDLSNTPRFSAEKRWTTCDLELLHFYTTSTSLTLSSIPEKQHVWQHIVPQIAFSNDFLLHGLLALSALHLSRIQPERKHSLRAQASSNHAAALPLFRAALVSIDSTNCHACSLFGAIIVVYEWALSENASSLFFTDAPHISDANTAQWVHLLRGSSSVIVCHYEELMNGPLQPIFLGAKDEAVSSPAETSRLSALEQLWDTSGVSVSAADVDSLKEALKSLKTIYSTNDPAIAAMSWLVVVPEHYLLMVNQRHPAALILLSHFCVLLNKVEDFWWIHGMSRSLLHEISRTLGEEWMDWISWPLQDLTLTEFRRQASSSRV